MQTELCGSDVSETNPGTRLGVCIRCEACASTRNSAMPHCVMQMFTVTAQLMEQIETLPRPEQRVLMPHAGMDHEAPPLFSPSQTWRLHEPS